MQKKEIGIIGGGASGLMAAIAAADSMKGRPGGIVLLEKKDRVGKKLLATGNGKCNLTNLSFSVENPGCYYRSRNPELLSAFFARFGVEDTLRQFERLGMLVTDKNGYVYPLSGQAPCVLLWRKGISGQLPNAGWNMPNTAGKAVIPVFIYRHGERAIYSGVLYWPAAARQVKKRRIWGVMNWQEVLGIP